MSAVQAKFTTIGAVCRLFMTCSKCRNIKRNRKFPGEFRTVIDGTEKEVVCRKCQVAEKNGKEKKDKTKSVAVGAVCRLFMTCRKCHNEKRNRKFPREYRSMIDGTEKEVVCRKCLVAIKKEKSKEKLEVAFEHDCCIYHISKEKAYRYVQEGAAEWTQFNYIKHRFGNKTNMKRMIRDRDHNRCIYCNNHATTVDHLVASTLGGISSPVNLVACCVKCNHMKDSVPLEQFLTKIEASEEIRKRVMMIQKFGADQLMDYQNSLV